MPFLQSSGAISINDIKNMFGGPGSPALSNYYRGGAYIPSSKTVTVRDPSSGEYYNLAIGGIWWEVTGGYTAVYWNGPGYVYQNGTGLNPTSVTSGGYTYYRGSLRAVVPQDYQPTSYYYGIYRTSSSTTSINTGIPSSGAISLSQFYGAEKP